MRGGHRVIVAALCLALAGGIAACGEDTADKTKVEGEPLELGSLKFNVQLTRFLNPDDPEDSEYLLGQPQPPADQAYLAVFMEIENDGDDPVRLPDQKQMKIVDTTDATYYPVPTKSIFALQLGTELGGGEKLPQEDTAAAAGPTQGSIVLFLVNNNVAENRPLELDIEADGERGSVELDI